MEEPRAAPSRGAIGGKERQPAVRTTPPCIHSILSIVWLYLHYFLHFHFAQVTAYTASWTFGCNLKQRSIFGFSLNWRGSGKP